MRPLALTFAAATLLATVGPTRAGDDNDERGRPLGRDPGVPMLLAGLDDDRRDFFKELAEQRREAARRFEKQQREARKRYEERLEDDRERREEARERYEERLEDDRERRREAAEDYYDDLEKEARRQRRNPGFGGYGLPAYPGPYIERHSGYRGYTPLAPESTYGPGPVAPGVGGLLPLLGGFDGDLPRPDDPYRRGQHFAPGNYGPSPILPGPLPTEGRITALAEQLLGQADAFLVAFAPQVGTVPQGERFMADARALRDAAARFRQVAVAGAPPDQLAAEFAEVVARWRRFEERTARVAKGRVGPNIATSLQMAETIQQIGQLMPDPRTFPGGGF